jgi:hypothetical protein
MKLVIASNDAKAADGTVDMKDPVAVAKAVLTAYKGKDLKTLSTLSLDVNKGFFSEMAENGEDHPRYGSIFGGWRWDAVKSWDGKTADARKADEETVQVKFHKMEGNEIAVVVLMKGKNGDWLFEDVNSPSASTFEALTKY